MSKYHEVIAYAGKSCEIYRDENAKKPSFVFGNACGLYNKLLRIISLRKQHEYIQADQIRDEMVGMFGSSIVNLVARKTGLSHLLK